MDCSFRSTGLAINFLFVDITLRSVGRWCPPISKLRRCPYRLLRVEHSVKYSVSS